MEPAGDTDSLRHDHRQVGPMALPASTVTMTAEAVPQPLFSSVAPSTLVNATTEPTLRSMPPLTMIMVMPSAPMLTMTVCERTVLKFAMLVKALSPS